MLIFEAFTVVFWVMTLCVLIHTHTWLCCKDQHSDGNTADKELQNTSSMAQPSEQQIIPSGDQTKNLYPLIIFYHVLYQKKISNYLKYQQKFDHETERTKSSKQSILE